ncbi:MAG: hypothetical protein GX493_12920 [Firmicutes bacterium]|nr:hypothetical protein [Bacillota bacterium]
MKSYLTEDFLACFRKLPSRIQRLARKSYRLWREDPTHPGLQFKLIGKRKPVYAIRVGIGWRALGIKIDDGIVWFWIGSHADYEKLISSM